MTIEPHHSLCLWDEKVRPEAGQDGERAKEDECPVTDALEHGGCDQTLRIVRRREQRHE